MPRYRPPGVIPLELWDLRLGDRILWDTIRELDFPAHLFASLRELHAGRGETRSEGPVPPAVKGFDAVFLCGGSAYDEALHVEAARAPWPVIISGHGPFIGEGGGRHLLQLHGFSGIVADLGQTTLKVSAVAGNETTRRWTFPRDLKRLRMRPLVPEEEFPAQRRELREFLGESLIQCAAESPTNVDALVLALPGRLDDVGIPEGSSYAGMADDARLIPDSLEIAKLSDLPSWLMNDAELAAMSARLHPETAAYRRTLVLTLGFGIGAALLINET